jgi:hypothetical protein
MMKTAKNVLMALSVCAITVWQAHATSRTPPNHCASAVSTTQTDGGSIPLSLEERLGCTQADARAACERRETFVGAVAAGLAVHPVQVNRGFGRYQLTEQKTSDWCDMSAIEQRAALVSALSPKKVRSEQDLTWKH